MSQSKLSKTEQNLEKIKDEIEEEIEADQNDEMDFFTIVHNINVPAVVRSRYYCVITAYLLRKMRKFCVT